MHLLVETRFNSRHKYAFLHVGRPFEGTGLLPLLTTPYVLAVVTAFTRQYSQRLNVFHAVSATDLQWTESRTDLEEELQSEKAAGAKTRVPVTHYPH